jgi:2',3'-cyclic-nucleotide 2'-phosphodiesterase (5'-nucleotidase family)
LRTADPNTIFLDTGDILSMRASINDDEIVAAVYPEMEYDALAVGDQEFVNGLNFFKTNLSGKLNFISSNLEFSDSGIKIEKYRVFTAPNGIRVGVTAVNFNTDLMYLTRKGVIEENDIKVGKAFENLKSVLSEMKNKADIILIMAQLNEYGLTRLIDEVDGYDLVIAGNNREEFKFARKIENKVHVQSGRDGEKIGKVTYYVGQDKKAVFKNYELIKVLAQKYERNEKIENIIRELEN